VEPTAKLNGEVFEMAIEFNKGAGVVEVVVVLTGVVLAADFDVDVGEQEPVNTIKKISNPAVKQYPISPVFVLFTLILRFYISLIGKMSIG
jgi:hypothetical protein